MSRSTRPIINAGIIGLASIFSSSLIFFRKDLGMFYQVVWGLLLAIIVFTLALALTKDSSLPAIIFGKSEKGEGILKRIPFARFLTATAVYVIFEVCALLLPQTASLAIEGGNITVTMLLLAAYETMQWYAVFLILTIRCGKPINIAGMILAFVLPYIIFIVRDALMLHNFHEIINNNYGLLSIMDKFMFNKYSQNDVTSTILQFVFAAFTPVTYVMIGHFMRKKKRRNKKKNRA